MGGSTRSRQAVIGAYHRYQCEVISEAGESDIQMTPSVDSEYPHYMIAWNSLNTWRSFDGHQYLTLLDVSEIWYSLDSVKETNKALFTATCRTWHSNFLARIQRIPQTDTRASKPG